MLKPTKKFPEVVKAAPVRVELEPINKAFLERLKKLEVELPGNLKDRIENSQEFFLNEIAPVSMGMLEGMRGAISLLEGVGLPVATQELSRMVVEHLTAAMSIKVMNKVSKEIGLTDEENALFVNLFLTRNGVSRDGNSDKEVLSAVQKILDMQRQEKESALLMRKVPKSRSESNRSVLPAAVARSRGQKSKKARGADRGA